MCKCGGSNDHMTAQAYWDAPTQDVGVSIAAAAAVVTSERPLCQGGIVKTPSRCGPAAKSVSVSSFAEASVVHRLHIGGCGVGMACKAMSCLWSCHAVSFGMPLLIPCQPLNSRLGGNMRSLFHIPFVTTPFTSIGRPLLISTRLIPMMTHRPLIGSVVVPRCKAIVSRLALQNIQKMCDGLSSVSPLPEHLVARSLS